MHDPCTVAFEIYLGRKQKKNGHYRTPFLTIWHRDPEKDGTDDSCGWFMRERHGDKAMLGKIKKAIEFDFDRTYQDEESNVIYYTGYFHPKAGTPNLSTMAIVLDMFSKAAWEFFNYNRKKQKKWMKENLYDILHFAENTTDSLKDEVLGTFRFGTGTEWKKEEALNHYVSVIYGYLLRSNRKWHQHPRWHFWHWQFQFPVLQGFWKKYFKKCDVCHKRGFGTTYGYGDWNGTKSWCEKCNDIRQNEITPQIAHN